MDATKSKSGQEKLGIRTAGYRLYALGFSLHFIGKSEQAKSFYIQAIDYAQSSNFSHLEALVTDGLAIMSRDLGNYTVAIKRHEEAIVKFLRLGSKKDLAEAYYQNALTLEAFNKSEESKLYYCKAIDIFREMKAPKQIERIKSSMSNSLNNL